MMAGLLIISIVSGAAGAIAALAMSQPFWVALLAYPVTGMITLLSAAALLSFRASHAARKHAFMPGGLAAAHARPRH